MKLTRGLLVCLTATLWAQDFPSIDTAKIEMALEKAKAAQEDALSRKDLFVDVPIAIEAAKRAQQELMASRDRLDRIPDTVFLAKEMALDKAAFALQKPFFYQGGLKGGGGPMTEDEELKAMAIEGLMQNDTERALPLVDKLLQNQQASLRLRLRALQSLGHSNSTKAREILARVAKDGSNSDLQLRALQMLGSNENAQNRQLLGEIYASASSVDVKRQVLRTWAGMGAKDQILNVAKTDPNTELRASAISLLGGMRANADLAALYGSETSTEIRERLLRSLVGGGDWQKLLEIAKTEKNEQLRNKAIQYVGSVRSTGASDALVELYNSTADASMRSAILRALSNQGSPKQIIALARKETNPDLKRAALQQLSRMKGDEVTTFLMELLDK